MLVHADRARTGGPAGASDAPPLDGILSGGILSGSIRSNVTGPSANIRAWRTRTRASSTSNRSSCTGA
ncbi:hypothetical protein GXY_01811 [Novacetimonas hansenii ATCC 23769]|uniref:Uncharacterized protein n=1 Tax=Novacetimonas hansenii ATCC 23769 TaxID=714995 RepID=D5QB71_NOVHA|nr:hypothetical protein GXY_01811 [Novacetimonas hansenii ATCC 23769]